MMPVLRITAVLPGVTKLALGIQGRGLALTVFRSALGRALFVLVGRAKGRAVLESALEEIT